jgi:hypothetical protein
MAGRGPMPTKTRETKSSAHRPLSAPRGVRHATASSRRRVRRPTLGPLVCKVDRGEPRPRRGRLLRPADQAPHLAARVHLRVLRAAARRLARVRPRAARHPQGQREDRARRAIACAELAGPVVFDGWKSPGVPKGKRRTSRDPDRRRVVRAGRQALRRCEDHDRQGPARRLLRGLRHGDPREERPGQDVSASRRPRARTTAASRRSSAPTKCTSGPATRSACTSCSRTAARSAPTRGS